MIGSRCLRPTLVICALALLAAGCSPRGTVHFPGSPIPRTVTAPAPSSPASQPVSPTDPVTELAPLSANGSDTDRRDGSAATDAAIATSIFEIEAPALDPMRAVTADLWPVVPDIDVPLNARVSRFVEVFAGGGKLSLEEGLSRGRQYLPMIRDVLRAEGLPLDLAYVPLVESAFKPRALSRAKARGIWQFMEGTGLENGLTHDWYIDERVEAEKATRAAAKYLKTLNTMFKGDWPLTLAAYNAGPSRVRRAMKRSGRTDYWTLTASSRSLPRETRDYVPRVMAAILIGRNPVHYGMNVQPIDAPRFETVMLSAAVDLRWIAEWVGTTVKAIQNLNPELRRWLTPIRAAYYHLKVPRGTGEIVRAHLARADPDALAPLDWHTVEKGDTLVAVARELKVSRIDLAEANYLSTRARLQSGQRLIVPRAPTLLLARRPDGPRPARELPTVDAALAANTTAAVAEPAPPVSLVHRVKRGDTLFSLARLYRTTVASLKNWNRLRSNTIRVGQYLTIFTGHATTATN